MEKTVDFTRGDGKAYQVPVSRMICVGEDSRKNYEVRAATRNDPIDRKDYEQEVSDGSHQLVCRL